MAAVAAILVGGCAPAPDGPSSGPTQSPAATSVTVASPSVDQSIEPDPPAPSLVVLAPASVRSACVGTDLTDANPEIDCSLEGVDLYLAMWGDAQHLRASLNEDFAVGQCDLVDQARGPIEVDGKRVGQGGGCADDPTFQFTSDRLLVRGSVYLEGQTFADAQTWFRVNRPTLSKQGALGGGALEPPIAKLGWSALVKRSQRVPYRAFARYTENYADRLLYFRAKVLQVTSDGALVLVTRDRSGSWGDLVFVTYTSVDPLLDGDIVAFVGRGTGTYSYVAVTGATKRVPSLDAVDLRRQ